MDIVYPVWPPNGASEVELDAPLVIAGYSLDNAQMSLTAGDGTQIELVERGRLESNPGDVESFSCAQLDYSFVTPKSPLTANTRYDLRTWYRHDLEITEGHSRSFRTGSTLRDIGPPAFELHAFTARTSSGDALEAFVEIAPREPLFVRASGQNAALAFDLDPTFYRAQSFRIPLGNVQCGELTLLDVTGHALATERVCQPADCALTVSSGIDDCGGSSFATTSTWADWSNASPGCSSADDAEGAPMDAGVPPLSGPRDEVALRPISTSEGKGCALAPRTQGRWHWLALGLLLCARRRRAREPALRVKSTARGTTPAWA